MLDFKKLKTINSLEKLQAAVENEAKANSFGDDPNEYWRPKIGKDGNGSAKIRWLPAPPQDDEDGLPWVKWYEYTFQGPGGWYINNSLATFNEPDPCQEYNGRLYATKIDANVKQAKKQNRNQRICANILILEDKLQPEFEGKVRKYKFGKKIFSKLDAAMKGDEDKEGFDPFSFFEGADFRIKIKTIKIPGERDQPNYDDSAFLERAALKMTDKELEAIWKSQFSLKEMLNRKNFKSYDDLLKDLTRVIGFDPRTLHLPIAAGIVATETVKPKVVEEDTPPWSTSTDEDSDQLLAKFQSLATED